MKSGIYKILNTENGKAYIGSSENLKRRLKDHKILLRTGKHFCNHLQYAYNKSGHESFAISVIEYCEIEKLIEREQYWLDNTPKELLYNLRVVAHSNRGHKFSEASKLKLKGRKPWNTGTKGIKPGTSGSIKKGERRGQGTEFKKGLTPWNKGITGKDSHMAGNTHTTGMPSWNKGLKGLKRIRIAQT